MSKRALRGKRKGSILPIERFFVPSGALYLPSDTISQVLYLPILAHMTATLPEHLCDFTFGMLFAAQIFWTAIMYLKGKNTRPAEGRIPLHGLAAYDQHHRISDLPVPFLGNGTCFRPYGPNI